MKTLRIGLVGVAMAAVGLYWLASQGTGREETLSFAEQISTRLAPVLRIEGRDVVFGSLEERMAHHKVPGVSIAFLEDHEIAWTLTSGVRDLETGAPVDEETVFQAASISKPVFATTLMRYRQEKGLDLDADVNTLLSRWQLPLHDWQASETVTLRRLLSHSAGITVHGFGGYATGDDVPDILDVLEGRAPANSRPVVVDIEPGSRFRYSGGGTTLAQLVLEEKSGEPLPQLAERLVLAPLGMTRSAYAQPLTMGFAANAAVPYRSDGKPVEGGAHTYAARAAAGLWTTPGDLMRLAGAMQLANRGETPGWLDGDSARDILTIQQEPLGLGFFLNDDEATPAFSHGGGNEGFRANFYAQIETGRGIAVMTNSDSGGELIKEIMMRVSEVYGWDVVQPTMKKLVALSEDGLAGFVGDYRLPEPVDFSVIVTPVEGGLLVNVAHYVVDTVFLPEGEDTFFAMDGSILTFQRDSAGIVSLTLHGNTATKAAETTRRTVAQ